VDAEDLDYLLFAARRLNYIGRSRQLQFAAAGQYTAAAAAFPGVAPAKKALETAVTSAQETADAVRELRQEYERLWLLENRPWWLKEMRGKYDSLLKDLDDQAQRLKAAQAEFAKSGVPPDPAAIGLALVETSRRNTFAVPTRDEVLPKDAKWWGGERWPRRMALKVQAGDTDLATCPVEVRVNFGDEKPDPTSLRVVEYSADGKVMPWPTQFDPAGPSSGNVVFLMPGQTAAKSARTFALYYDLAGSQPKPAQDYAGVTAKEEQGSVWVENSQAKMLVGPQGAHVFEWYVKALNNAEITEPGRGGWAGFADSGFVDRDAPFRIKVEAAGPVMVRLRATSDAAGSEKVFTFYAGLPLAEVMLAGPVGFYWDYDNAENFAADKPHPGTALFSNGHKEPVCKSNETIHAAANGVTWGAKIRDDGLLLANITPEVEGNHMTGPGGGWGGVGIEGSAPAAHFITVADKIEGDPAAFLNAIQQTLDMRHQPKLWIGPPTAR
jgi:hypothetical protein